MKRRGLDPKASHLEQFRALQQVSSLTDSARREVIRHAHAGIIDAVRIVDLGNDVRMPLLDIPALVQQKVNACGVFKKILRSAVRQHRGHLCMILYVDEVIAGNPLRPEPSRKALVGYTAFLECSHLWLESMWLTYFLIRSEEMSTAEGGCAGVLNRALLAARASTREGFAVGWSEGDCDLLFCTEVLFLADADGLRMATGWKGAAAIRPCPKCSNVVANGRSAPGYVDITGAPELCQLCSHEELMAIFEHLTGITKKGELMEAEKLLGWKREELRASFLTNPDLRGWIRLEHLHVDPMHIYYSNGLVAQELGLWWTAACEHFGGNVCEASLKQYVCLWEAVPGSALHQRPWESYVSSKLLKPEMDYRGDAGQCMCSASNLCGLLPGSHAGPLETTSRESVRASSCLSCVARHQMEPRHFR